MKNFVEKIKKLVKRHKILSMICLLSIVIIIVLLYIFCSIFVGGNDKYGHRLDGIKEVELSKSDLEKVKDEIQKNDSVETADVRIKGKIIWIDITFSEKTKLEDAKKVAASTLENFDEKELNFYDVDYVLSAKGTDGFKITGAKSPKEKEISFIKS